MNQRLERRTRHVAGVVFFVIVLGVVAWLALVPNNRGQFLGFLPEKLRRWICEHDDFNNVVAFSVLGSVAFRIRTGGTGSRGNGLTGLLGEIFAHRLARLAALMVFICLLELMQLVIPGRQSGLQDVCTGWSGLFAAWLSSAVLDAVAARRG